LTQPVNWVRLKVEIHEIHEIQRENDDASVLGFPHKSHK